MGDCYVIRRSSGRIAFDYFNRANGALGTADSGQSWITPAETLSIVSNKAARTTATPSLGVNAFLPTGAQAHVIDSDITLGSGDLAGLRVLSSTSSPEQNGWAVYFNGSDAYIVLFQSGGITTHATASFNWTAGATKHVKVSASQSGTTISIVAYVDGVSVVTSNYASAPTGTLTYAGLFLLKTGSAPTSTFDNVVITR